MEKLKTSGKWDRAVKIVETLKFIFLLWDTENLQIEYI